MRCSKAISPVVVLQPQVIRHFGASTAAFLSQLNYWIQGNKSGIIHKRMRWIFNTAQEWGQQIGISDRQVRRIVAELRNAGIILVEKLADYKSNRTNYYTINYERLNQLFDEKQGSSQDVFSVSASCGQDVLMVKTKITNRKNNLSESEGLLSNSQQEPSISSNQVEGYPKEIAQENKGEGNEGASIRNMLAYWNTTFPNNQVEMNRDLAPLLMAALRTKFSSNIIQWQHYCRTIESSAYLMGKSFNLSIYWALKYITIDRIKAGEFGVKSLALPGEQQNLEKEFIQQIKQLSEPEKCKDVRLKLLKVYGAFAYKHWFQALKFFVSGERVSYTAPTPFHGDYVAREYRDILRRV